jgi:hypothetical protein
MQAVLGSGKALSALRLRVLFERFVGAGSVTAVDRWIEMGILI